MIFLINYFFFVKDIDKYLEHNIEYCKGKHMGSIKIETSDHSISLRIPTR